MKFVTSSELRVPFAREVTTVAHTTVRKAKNKALESAAVPSPNDTSTLPEMDVDTFKEVIFVLSPPAYSLTAALFR
jgi:hypothetical protein